MLPYSCKWAVRDRVTLINAYRTRDSVVHYLVRSSREIETPALRPVLCLGAEAFQSGGVVEHFGR